MRRHLAIVLLTSAISLAVVAGAAAIVDPYGLNGWVRMEGINFVKPASYLQVGPAKARRFARANPATVILGNSRVDIGFDPESPAWPAPFRPLYNFGIPGGGLYDVLRSYLLARDHGVRRLIVGLDFADFLVDDAPLPGDLDRYAALDAGMPVGLFVQSHLSIRAALDTVKTLLAQGDPYAEDMTDAGFNPLRQYIPIMRQEGHAAVAAQRSRENVAAYLKRARTLRAPDGGPNRPMAELAHLLADARSRGIEVHLFTYPYHADLMETLADLELWPLLDDWKREIRALAMAPETRAASLWDFATFNDYTTERIPPPGDTTSDMAWYWEPGHFKPSLGDRMIAAMYGTERTLGDPVAAPGRNLMLADIDAELADIRTREGRYRAERAPDAERIIRMVAEQRQSAAGGGKF